MFMSGKYRNKLGNCEAECVQEVLDMVSDDEPAARLLVIEAIDEIKTHRKAMAAYRNCCDTYDKQRRVLPSLWRWVWRLPLPVKELEPQKLSEFAESVAAISFATGGQWWCTGLEKLGRTMEGSIETS